MFMIAAESVQLFEQVQPPELDVKISSCRANDGADKQLGAGVKQRHEAHHLMICDVISPIITSIALGI